MATRSRRTAATDPRIRRLPLRVLAATLALLLLSGSGLQIAHFLIVPHAVCAEHGELLEVHEGDSHDAHASEASDTHDATREAARSAPSSEHDHCELLARNGRELVIPPSEDPSVPEAYASGRQEAGCWVSPRPCAFPVWLLAPKTSPPGRT